jgi:hypothetical protein
MFHYITIIEMPNEYSAASDYLTFTTVACSLYKPCTDHCQLSGKYLKYFSVYGLCYAMIARWAAIPEPFLGKNSINTLALVGSRFLILLQLDFNN